VNRAEDASRLDGHHPHAKLAPCHALDLRTKVNRCKYLHRNTLRLGCRLFIAHRALLCVLPGPRAASVASGSAVRAQLLHAEVGLWRDAPRTATRPQPGPSSSSSHTPSTVWTPAGRAWRGRSG